MHFGHFHTWQLFSGVKVLLLNCQTVHFFLSAGFDVEVKNTQNRHQNPTYFTVT